MKPDRPIRHLLSAAILSAIALSSCLYGSGSDGGGSSSCGQAHVMPGHSAVWTYADCGPFLTKWIQQSTQDTSNGAALGSRDVGRGMLSFKYTGLHNRNFRLNQLTYGVYFLAEGFNRLEANWRWQAMNLGNGYVRNEIVSQRNDVTCPRAVKECVSTVQTMDLQYENAGEVIQWDCQWNADDFIIKCDVTKPGNPSFKVTLTNDMLGPYHALKYLGVGAQAYDGSTPSFDVKVTDFRVTFFE